MIVAVSNEECLLLIRVVTECLHECRDDPQDLRLHLKADSPSEVEALLSRLQSL
jgi:hypothetical protein